MNEWIKVTGYGQIKPGALIKFKSGDQIIETTVKDVHFSGTKHEEIIYDKKNNYYFIVQMVIEGSSHAKDLVYKHDTITLPITEYEQLRKDAERYRWIKSIRSDIHLMFGTYNLQTCYADLTSALCGNTLDEAIDQAMKDKP
jgi:hypothetical protein